MPSFSGFADKLLGAIDGSMTPGGMQCAWSLRYMADTVSCADVDGQLVGAATLRWNDQPPEILELAIAEVQQGRGFGRQPLPW